MSKKQKRQIESMRLREGQRRVPVWPFFLGAAALVAVVTIFLLVQRPQPAGTYTPEVTGSPSASIDRAMFDYGDVKLGKTSKTQFHVKNVGDTQLVFAGEPRVKVLEGC
jgi:hypothetical protein